MYSVKSWIEDWKTHHINDWSYYWLYLGNFLDEFYKEPNLCYLIEEPDFSCVEKYIASFTVSCICYLCDKNDFERPSWTNNMKYYMEEPWFSGNTKGPLRCYYLLESPQAFKVRNMFVSNKVLDRC